MDHSCGRRRGGRGDNSNSEIIECKRDAKVLDDERVFNVVHQRLAVHLLARADIFRFEEVRLHGVGNVHDERRVPRVSKAAESLLSPYGESRA